jgi:ribonuclease D
MMMSNLEIASTYRQAKQPLKQIGILAELNGVSRKEIAKILRSEGCELPARYQEKQPKEPLQEDTFQDYAEIGKAEEPRDIMRLANLAYERMIEAQRTACRLCNLLSGDDFWPTSTGAPENLRDMLAENLTAAAYVAELLEQARQALEGDDG